MTETFQPQSHSALRLNAVSLSHPLKMAPYDWGGCPMTKWTMADWRYTLAESGGWCAMRRLVSKRRMWFASNWASHQHGYIVMIQSKALCARVCACVYVHVCVVGMVLKLATYLYTLGLFEATCIWQN